MYMYCVYPSMSKSPKQLTNCLKRKACLASIVFIVFNDAHYHLKFFALILLLFLSVAQHESGTRKTIFWSVTAYSKNLSSHCIDSSNRPSPGIELN